VCLGDVIGMRYPVEDALRSHELEPVARCMFADVRIRETGAPGAYTLGYQRIGETDWKSCESSQQDRAAFLDECVERIVEEFGTPPPPTASGD
jgi:hypothetical protein